VAIFEGLDLTNELTKEKAQEVLAQKGVTDEQVAESITEMREALVKEEALAAGVGTVLQMVATLAKIGLKVVA